MSLLGKGGLATVVKISNQYALKVLSDARAAEEEAAILELLGASSTIVGFYGRLGEAYETGFQHAALLLELCDGSLGDLLSSLGGQRLRSASELQAQQYIVMMVNCVAQLHGHGVIHQDIKPSNFLFSRDGSIKLCDFNLSRLHSDTTRAIGGTLLYFSPQKFSNADDGYATDWWALGVTLYQMLHGLQTWPFSTRSLRRISKLPPEEQLLLIRKAVLKGNLCFRSLFGVPRAARTLIRGLLHPRPERRWSLLHVLAGDYPADQAFSAVALRHPHLGADMERLLAVRRLCRAGPSPSLSWRQSVPWAFEEHDGALDASEPPDAKPSVRTSMYRSLRALSSRLLSRKRAYKCSSPRAAPELNDVSPHDQLGLESEPDEPQAALQTPNGAGIPIGTANGAGLTIGTADGAGLPIGTAHSEAPPVPIVVPAPRLPQHATHVEPSEAYWTSLTGRCLPSGFSSSKSLSWRKALLPRSDSAVRAAAVQALSAAACAPQALLTPDGRLAPPPFVPCEARTHTLDLAAVCEALSAANAAGAGAADSEQPLVVAVAGRAAAANAAGQVQGVEVLEEMRHMFERRRLSANCVAASGDSGSAAGARRPTGQLQPAAHSSNHHQGGESPLWVRLALPDDEQPGGAASSARAQAAADAALADGREGSVGVSRFADACGSEEAEVKATVRPSPARSTLSTHAAFVSCAAQSSPAGKRTGCRTSTGAAWDGAAAAAATAGKLGAEAGAEATTAPALHYHHHYGGAHQTTSVEAGVSQQPPNVKEVVRDMDDAGRCAAAAAASASSSKPRFPFSAQAADADSGRSSWSGGRLACAAASGSPKGAARHGGGALRQRRGAFHAVGCCSSPLHAGGSGGGSGGRSAAFCSRRAYEPPLQDPRGSGCRSGSDSASHADEAGSLFSIPFSDVLLGSGGEEGAAAAATGTEAAAAVAPEAAVSALHRAHAQQQQQPAAGAAVQGVRPQAAEATAEQPAVSTGVCRSRAGAVEEGLAPPALEDERPTWGSAIATAAGAAAAGGGGGGGVEEGSGRRRARGGREGEVADSGGAAGSRGRGSQQSHSATTSSAASDSPQSSSGAACSAVGPTAGRTVGAGATRRSGSTAEAGSCGGGKGRAQRARDAGGMAAQSGAWGTTSNRVWSYRNGAPVRAVRQVGA